MRLVRSVLRRPSHCAFWNPIIGVSCPDLQSHGAHCAVCRRCEQLRRRVMRAERLHRAADGEDRRVLRMLHGGEP